MQVGETIKSAISKWYFENGIPEPNWFSNKDPQWWIDYLNEINNK